MCKKLVFLSFLPVLFAVSAQANLIAYYPFESNANDMSGYSTISNGTLVGTPTYDAGPANFGQALKVSSTSNYVNCGNDSKFNITGPITVCAWIKVTAWTTNWNAVVTKGDNSWRLHRDNATDHLNWTCSGTTGGGVSGTKAVNDNQWHHVAGVYDGANLILYVDGIVDGQAASTGSITTNTNNMYICENATYTGRTFNGWIDEVRIYDSALSAGEVLTVMIGKQGPAISPQPADGSTDISIDMGGISWKPGKYANTHNVFIGTDFNDVNEATVASHAGVTLTQALDVNYMNLGTLEFGMTYYWRVDEVNAPSKPFTYQGTTWSFTVEPIAIKLPKEDITVESRSNSIRNNPINTINEAGIDPNTDKHFTSGVWLSGNITDVNDPIWIRYDFGRLYKIHEMLVWNFNGLQSQKYGFKQVRIEYSTDGGLSWNVVSTVTEFAPGTGADGSAYNAIVPFNDIAASSVRITALSTWEITKYTKAGLSEVRFNVIPTLARAPSPESGAKDVPVDTILSWRSGREADRHDVYISTDSAAVVNHSVPAHNVTTNKYAPLLDFGKTYYWSVTEVNDFTAPKRWDGYIWNFTAAEYASLDDFENYTGDEGNEIWSTWIDGFYDNANGSIMGLTNSPYVEKTIVQNGAQSAPISYDNSGILEPAAIYSEVTRTYATPLNLKISGADSLKLYYRGRAVTFAEPSPGVIAMSGEGTDIGGTSDQFRFVYKTLNGNGSITARVDSVQFTSANAEAGIMIRNSIDPNSAHAMSFIRPNGNVSLQYRNSKGSDSTYVNLAGLGSPYWVKITRIGNTLTAERSADGEKWLSYETDPNQPSIVTVTTGLNNSVLIGFAVCSRSATTLCAATFSGALFTGDVSGNWTIASIGDTEQAEGLNTIDALYVMFEDSAGKKAKVFAPGNAVGSGRWIEWIVPYSQFTQVDMSKVKKFSIGIGDTAAPAKGKGMVYIDNISYGHTVVE